METKFSYDYVVDNPNRSLGKQINYIARTLRWIADYELRQTELTTATYMLIRVVHCNPGIIQKELGEETRIDKATTAKGVAKLESLGYLKRFSDKDDGRVRRLYLTDGGNRIIPSVQAALRRVTEICVTDLTESGLNQLFGLLDRVEMAVSTYVADVKGDCTKL